MKKIIISAIVAILFATNAMGIVIEKIMLPTNAEKKELKLKELIYELESEVEQINQKTNEINKILKELKKELQNANK